MKSNLTRRQWAFLRELARGPLRWYANDPDGQVIRRHGLAVYDRGAFWFHYVITPAGRAAIASKCLTAGTPRRYAFARRTLSASIPVTVPFHSRAERRAA